MILRSQIGGKMVADTKTTICHYYTAFLMILRVVVDLPRRGHRRKNCSAQAKLLPSTEKLFNRLRQFQTFEPAGSVRWNS
jgi:hypothetical protein